MSRLDTSSLIDSISQSLEIHPDVLRAMTDEICGASIPYKTLYSDFQSGGWHNAILYATGEENSDDTIRDGVASPTPLAKLLPITRQFLEELGLDFFAVRIACNDPNSWLWEHCDYVELDEEKMRLRLHVALVTNPDAVMQFSQCTVHMVPGWIWKLDPTISHAISNTGTDSRTHIILDCYKSRVLRKMLGNETLEEELVQPLPRLDAEGRGKLLMQAQDLFTKKGSEKAEQYLLKTFHKFDLGEETSYDLLVNFYRDMGFRRRENHWIAEQITRLYNLNKIDPDAAMRKMRGMLFSNPHASISDLPQFSIFQQVLRTCRQYPGLEQAYVRGSLARGDANPHSDIDLLCVIAPQDFASFAKKVNAGIKEHHNSVAEGLYQLDFYVACQGHPSLDYLNRVPHKQEIFRQNRKQGHKQRRDALNYRLHGEMVEQEIKRINGIEPSISRTLTELSVLGFMIKKCLKRGDEFVASNIHKMWKKCFIRLVRFRFDTQHRDYGFYHVKQLINEDLRAINNHPLTGENFMHAYCYAMDFVQKYFHEDFARQQTMIHAVTWYLDDSKPELLAHQLTPWTQTTLNLTRSA